MIHLDREAEGGHQIVVGPDAEGTVPVVGILVDSDLVAQQLFGQDGSLCGSRKVQALGLEERLEP